MDRSVRSRSPGARGFPGGLLSLRRSFISCPLKYARSMVVSMNISIGVKRAQAQRPRASRKPPALDRRPHGVILGYARLPLASRSPGGHRRGGHPLAGVEQANATVLFG